MRRTSSWGVGQVARRAVPRPRSNRTNDESVSSLRRVTRNSARRHDDRVAAGPRKDLLAERREKEKRGRGRGGDFRRLLRLLLRAPFDICTPPLPCTTTTTPRETSRDDVPPPKERRRNPYVADGVPRRHGERRRPRVSASSTHRHEPHRGRGLGTRRRIVVPPQKNEAGMWGRPLIHPRERRSSRSVISIPFLPQHLCCRGHSHSCEISRRCTVKWVPLQTYVCISSTILS